MIYGSNDSGAQLTLSKREHKFFQKGKPIFKKSAYSGGRFCVCAFMYNETEVSSLPLTTQQVSDKVSETGELKVVFPIDLEELACVSFNGLIDGLNDHCEEHILPIELGLCQNFAYQVVGFTPHNEVLIEFTCQVDLEELKDVME